MVVFTALGGGEMRLHFVVLGMRGGMWVFGHGQLRLYSTHWSSMGHSPYAHAPVQDSW